MYTYSSADIHIRIRISALLWYTYIQLLYAYMQGMLAVSDNENERKRLLLKVLAVSDIVIYVTRAERLHQVCYQ